MGDNLFNSLLNFLLSVHSALLSLNPGLESNSLIPRFVASQHLLAKPKDFIFHTVVITLECCVVKGTF